MTRYNNVGILAVSHKGDFNPMMVVEDVYKPHIFGIPDPNGVVLTCSDNPYI